MMPMLTPTRSRAIGAGLLELLWWGGVTAVAAASVWPRPELASAAPTLMEMPDKLQHAAVYALLASSSVMLGGRWPVKLMFLAALGLALEFLQAFTPTRTFEWWDAAANWAGIAMGALVARAVPGRMP